MKALIFLSFIIVVHLPIGTYANICSGPLDPMFNPNKTAESLYYLFDTGKVVSIGIGACDPITGGKTKKYK